MMDQRARKRKAKMARSKGIAQVCLASAYARPNHDPNDSGRLYSLPPSVPSPVCVASVVQQSPHGPFHFVPSCAFFPCSCLSISPTPPPLVHARATATTATRGCASSTGGIDATATTATRGCAPSRRAVAGGKEPPGRGNLT
jgi:hypothetical protein